MKRMANGLVLGVLALVVGCGTYTATAPAPAPMRANEPKASPSDLGESTAVTPAAPNTLTPANTKIEWVGTKAEGKHDGGFKDYSGSLDLKGNDATAAKISLEINTNSLYSDTPKLTGHLKTPDFFDVKTYPKATFVTTGIKAGGDGATHTVAGDLTLHGVTKSITFPATIKVTDDTLDLSTEFKINRQDFGMNYGTGKVHDDVQLKISSKVARK
jgi:polyisoprenoid-binding protein YceI